MLTLIVAMVALLAGGYGGYRWGRSVEAKAASLLGGAAKKLG